jgi:predicted nucleic acid-binding protein
MLSALSIAEVLYLKGDGPRKLLSESREKVRQFFRRSYFVVVDVDRFIAEEAQDLFWRFHGEGLMPKDAVHLATAVHVHANFLETFDRRLLALNGRVGTEYGLVIQTPGHDLLNPLAGGVEATGQTIFDARERETR